MIVSMNLELRDIPGQLIEALRPISDHGGNIRSIVHHRGKITPRGMIPVQITIEIQESKLGGLLEELEKGGVIVARIGEERLKEGVSVILIGHIVHSDIRDTIDVIDRTGSAEVVDLSICMPGIDARSSASMKISATDREELLKSLKTLREVVDKKDLLMITPIDIQV
jgi:ACT domain-containing protein